MNVKVCESCVYGEGLDRVSVAKQAGNCISITRLCDGTTVRYMNSEALILNQLIDKLSEAPGDTGHMLGIVLNHAYIVRALEEVQ